MSPRATGTSAAWDALVETCAHLPFEPHDIASQLDARGRYEVPLDGEFAFNIRLFHYTSRQHTRGGGRGTNVWSCSYRSTAPQSFGWAIGPSSSRRETYSSSSTSPFIMS